MNAQESFLTALQAMAANKLRTALTMLGLIVGIAGVILLLAIGQGVQHQITAEIQSLGTDLLFVMPGRDVRGAMRAAMGSAGTLTLEDAEAISSPNGISAVKKVVPGSTTIGRVVWGRESMIVPVIGTTEEFMDVMNVTLTQGAFFSRQQVASRANVVVFTKTAAKTLFGEEHPLDQWVRINDVRFRVIGVLESVGGSLLSNQDDSIMVPITTALAQLAVHRTSRGGRVISNVMIQAAGADHINVAKEEVSTLLRQRHRLLDGDEDDFSVTTMDEALGIIGTVTGLITAFLAAIAAISLVVGGVGIMNIMLVSVTERTREIGIRKAVGARRRDILMQFLAEATVLSLSGGMAGVALGWSLARGIGIAAGEAFPPPLVTPNVVLLAFFVSIAIGLFFGIYPAARAARLNPIDALRYE